MRTSGSFTPIRPNPYIVGNPVRNPKMFFGRETEFQEVVRRFKPSAEGALMVFCGERRSGKTSILFQILDGRLGPEFIPVLIDMQSMAVEGEIEFLSRIASEIVNQLDREKQGIQIPEFSRSGQPSSVFREFIEDILRHHPERKLILLFDEYELFEDKIDAGILTDNVLRILSSLMEHLPTFLIFTGSQFLEQRRKSYWGILAKATSHQRISYLSREDATRLVREPVAESVVYGSGVVDSILRLTGGQPFYTQAVCQNLVDTLNEERTNEVTPEILAEVTEHLVETPLPQMIFLWQRLEQDQKLTLALVAECLENDARYATADEVEQTLRRSKYPVNLTKPAIATALEALREQELLEADREQPRGYRFCMDLWRVWIRRMHSMWQVMREEGLSYRRRSDRLPLVATVGGLAAVSAIALGAWLLWPQSPESPPSSPALAPTPLGSLSVVPSPADAVVHLDGNPVKVGPYEGRVAPGVHTVLLQAAGYVDSTFTATVVEDSMISHEVSLRPKTGRLVVRTQVPDADIFVDGAAAGRGSCSLANLAVPDNPYAVEIHHPDFAPWKSEVNVLADSTRVLSPELARRTVTVTITSEPVGARITVDGSPVGAAPRVLSLAVGSHRFKAELEGHLPVDTTLAVRNAGDVPFLLLPVPPGILELNGDQYADIFIDDQPVGSGQLKQSIARLSPGPHKVEVVFSDDSSDELMVPVVSGQTVRVSWSAKKLRIAAESER